MTMKSEADGIYGRHDFEERVAAPIHMFQLHEAWSPIARKAWQAATQRCIDIVERYQVPVGNSAAGELAREWTMEALLEIRNEIVGALDRPADTTEHDARGKTQDKGTTAGDANVRTDAQGATMESGTARSGIDYASARDSDSGGR